MQNDKLIKITDMTIDHLKNAIELFYNTGMREEEVEALRLELQYREQVQSETPRGQSGMPRRKRLPRKRTYRT